MSFAGPYREVKREIISDEESSPLPSDDNLEDFDNSVVGFAPQLPPQPTMDAAGVDRIVQAALLAQKQAFDAQLDALRQQVSTLRVAAPEIQVYQRIVVDPTVQCPISLDVVKSMPDFDGAQEDYVAWRQSATDAYELFRSYSTSSVHYQAVIIIRNKIRGNARALLTSHNTVLNFDAIIARLDCTYADKTSLRLLRQNLEMVRQGDSSLMQYYDDVERKLTLVTNKIIMTHEAAMATLLNNEVRADALHAFISGLKRSLKAIVFPAQPGDLPAALALAREAEASIERSNFAVSYARVMEERAHSNEHNKSQTRQDKHGRNNNPNQEKNPHFVKKQGKQPQSGDHAQQQPKPPQQSEPMDVDPSMSKVRQLTNWRDRPAQQSVNGQAAKRPNSSERHTGPRRQRLNRVVQHNEYDEAAAEAVGEILDDSDSLEDNDLVNFLGVNPGYRSSSGSWLGEQ